MTTRAHVLTLTLLLSLTVACGVPGEMEYEPNNDPDPGQTGSTTPAQTMDMGDDPDEGTPSTEDEDMSETEPDMMDPPEMPPALDMGPSTASGDGVRADVCGTDPVPFVKESQGDWEVIAEAGMLDGEMVAFTFLEGPVWSDDDGALYFSDFNKNSALNEDDLGAPTIIWKYDPATGSVTNAFPEGSIRANGMARDKDGNILVADHGSRGIGKIARDGTYTIIADTFEGSPFNAPNDLVATSDGSIYFTDPAYNSGVDGRDRPIGHEGVYRIAPTGDVELIQEGLRRPNGITTSLDERWLFVSFKDESKIYRYPLHETGQAGEGAIFIERQATDGVTLDCAGNLYLAVPGKRIAAFNPDTGEKIWEPGGRRSVTNLAFGGAAHNELYITEHTRLLRRTLTTPGMPY